MSKVSKRVLNLIGSYIEQERKRKGEKGQKKEKGEKRNP